MRDRQSTPDTKSHHSQPTKERETQRTTAQEEALVTQQDPLTQTISGIGSPPSAKVHANLLSRATADHLARGRQLMLQMQRQYGNRYVQRVVELSRQGAGETEATPEVEATIEQARGGGRSLDAGIQRQMESAFGTNFSGVRVHTDSTADALNQSLSARAFTTGQDIFFRQGEYNPGSSSGKELLAHELTHVVQQTGTVRGKLAIGEAGDRYEQEADKVASEVLQRLDAPAAVQRQEAIEEEIQTKLTEKELAAIIGPNTPGDRTFTPLPLETFGSKQSTENKEPIQKKGLEKITTAIKPVLQRLPVRNNSDHRRQVREYVLHTIGYQYWDTLVTRIGSSTLVEDVGLPKLAAMLRNSNFNVDLIAQVLNEATQIEVNNINGSTGVIPAAFFHLNELRLPTDEEVDRYYTNYLRVENPPYDPNMFTAFRNNMKANGGQYWDFTAHQFQRLAQGFRDVYNNAPVGGVAFSNAIYSGNNVNFVNHMTVPVPGWIFNPALAIGYELNAAPNPLNVPGGYGRPFNDAMRRAVAQVHARPQAAQAIINLGGGVAARLNSLMDAVSVSAIPAQMLNVLALVLVPPGGAAPHAPGFLTALNHINELAAAEPRLNPMVNGMPFGNRAGGLRQHFTKHPLGVQVAAHRNTATWESQQWMNLLNLAPNGLITRGNLPHLPQYGRKEWEIFAQHAYSYNWYYWWYYNQVNNGSQPTNNNERDALITYLQDNAPAPPGNAGPNADSIAAAHERVYENYVSNQFDAAPNRYLYWDAGNLKVSAMAGNLFMVAAWNGAGNFDLSTGFLINGGAAVQFNQNLPTKIMNV